MMVILGFLAPVGKTTRCTHTSHSAMDVEAPFYIVVFGDNLSGLLRTLVIELPLYLSTFPGPSAEQLRFPMLTE